MLNNEQENKEKKKRWKIIVIVACLAIITITLIKGVYWPDVKWYMFRQAPAVLTAVVSGIIYPTKVDPECIIVNGGEGCCDKSGYPMNCASTMRLSPANYCYKYLRNCEMQSNGKCGWSVNDRSRENQCEKNHEYPDWKP